MPNTARQRLVKADTNYGPVGDNTQRTAAQIGNSAGPADFGSGSITAQTLRTTLAQGTTVGVTPVSNGVYTFDENVAVSVGSWTTIVSYAPAALHFFKRASSSGEGDAEFRVRVNGAVVEKQRNNWTDRNMKFDWGDNGIPVQAGQVIEIQVFNNSGETASFNGTLYGEEV